MLAGLFFFGCAILYNPWTIQIAVHAARSLLHRPWTRLPNPADVHRMELVYAALGAVVWGWSLLLGSRESLDRFFRRSLVEKLVLAFVAFLIPFATLEVALRPYTTQLGKQTSLFVKDNTLGWKMRPSTKQPWGGVMVTTNAKGLRGPEVAYEKPAGVVRVLYLGDSVAFGYMVARWQNTFPFIADTLVARAAGVRVETIDAGVGGYSPWQEFRYLRDEGMRYDPDVVVVNFVLNDVTEKFTLVQYGGYEEPVQLRNSYYSWLDVILSHSALVYQVKNFAREWKARRVLGSDTQLGAIKKEIFDVETMMRHPNDEHVQGAWKMTLENLQEIFDLCRERGVSTLLVIHPFAVQLDDPAALDAPQRQLGAYAREHGIRTVDLLPILRRHLDENGRTALSLYLDHDHLSIEGHRVAAAAIADTLSAIVEERRARR
jgi:hypothetical protein